MLLITTFNHHHRIWTGRCNRLRAHEGSPVLRFAAASGLQPILAPELITWRHQSRAYTSTVDVTFANENVVQGFEA